MLSRAKKCVYNKMEKKFLPRFFPILHRFRDTATYWLKIAYFSHPSLIWRHRSLGSLSNFAARLTMMKLESWGYPVVTVA